MGSPYFVHKQVNRIHVAKTPEGFERILKVICHSMGFDITAVTAETCWPEWVVLNDLYSAEREAANTSSRVVVFLEARYEWTGWKKFQRVVIIDYSGKAKKLDPR